MGLRAHVRKLVLACAGRLLETILPQAPDSLKVCGGEGAQISRRLKPSFSRSQDAQVLGAEVISG